MGSIILRQYHEVSSADVLQRAYDWVSAATSDGVLSIMEKAEVRGNWASMVDIKDSLLTQAAGFSINTTTDADFRATAAPGLQFFLHTLYNVLVAAEVWSAPSSSTTVDKATINGHMANFRNQCQVCTGRLAMEAKSLADTAQSAADAAQDAADAAQEAADAAQEAADDAYTLADGKSKVISSTSVYAPGGMTGNIGDYCHRLYDGTIYFYEKTGSTTWTLKGKYKLGADNTESAIPGVPVSSFPFVDAGYLSAILINADDINAGTITGRTLRTSASGQRFIVSASTNTASFYNSSGVEVVNIAYTDTDGEGRPPTYSIFGLPSGLMTGVYAQSGTGFAIVAETAYTGSDGGAVYGVNKSSGTGVGGSSAAYNGGYGVYGRCGLAHSSSAGVAAQGYRGFQADAVYVGFDVKTTTRTPSYGIRAIGSTYSGHFTGSVYVDGTVFPFTGSHEGIVSDDFVGEVGDILVDIAVANKGGISNAIGFNALSSTPKQKSVFGVLSSVQDFVSDDFTVEPGDKLFAGSKNRLLAQLDGISNVYDLRTFWEQNLQIPIALRDLDGEAVTEKNWEKHKTLLIDILSHCKKVGVNAIGEGLINVCREGGDIDVGDYICSSSIPGKGMKQDDDLMHNHTIAKARETVSWAEGDDSIKMIACTYHCG